MTRLQIWAVIACATLAVAAALLLTRYSYSPNGFGGTYRVDRWTGRTVVCGADGRCGAAAVSASSGERNVGVPNPNFDPDGKPVGQAGQFDPNVKPIQP